MSYDALGRLYELTGGGFGQYIYDGVEAAGFAPVGSNTLQNRFIRGPGVDEIIANYTGAGPTPTQYWLADERGSLVNLSEAGAGTTTIINTYNAYGVPAPSNLGRFQYTGQLWMPDDGAYHYKARAYQPGLGRFLQADPIGCQARMNLYAYVGSDPINAIDPWGLMDEEAPTDIGQLPVFCRKGVIRCAVGTGGSRPTYRELIGLRAPPERADGGEGTRLPGCIITFLQPELSNDLTQVRLHRGGHSFNDRGYSVTTSATSIHLVPSVYDQFYATLGRVHVVHVFHELFHTEQYSLGELGKGGAVRGYIGSFLRGNFTIEKIHDNAGFESRAISFEVTYYTVWSNEGRSDSCR